MADQQKEARMLRLSQAPRLNKTLKGSYIVIEGTGYVGSTTVQATEVFGKVAKARRHQEKPACIWLADSASKPGDVVAVPEMTGSADHIELEWIRQGKKIRMDLSKFMAFKEIKIPEGMNLYIPVYEETDNDLGGAVVGWNLQEMQFVSVGQRGKREAAAAKE